MALALLSDALGGQRGRRLVNARSLNSLDTLPIQPGRQSLEPELLDAATRQCLPLTFTPEGESATSLAHAKLVLPGSTQAWYPSAFDGQDLCFGLQVEYDITYDYFSLSDLQRLIYHPRHRVT